MSARTQRSLDLAQAYGLLERAEELTYDILVTVSDSGPGQEMTAAEALADITEVERIIFDRATRPDALADLARRVQRLQRLLEVARGERTAAKPRTREEFRSPLSARVV